MGDVVTLHVDNEYTFDPAVPDRASIRNVANRLVIYSNETEVLIAPLSRQQCFALAHNFLTVAMNDRNWEGIEE